ncbi:MAG TPA: hypothetical protein DEW46_17580 [Verrucomicrobia bacterium]|jgi:hypothetical protein|nr:hypothetical protein [Verrucomicrobiota bacterium]
MGGVFGWNAEWAIPIPSERVDGEASSGLFEPIGAQLKALRLLIGRTRAEAQEGERGELLARLR